MKQSQAVIKLREIYSLLRIKVSRGYVAREIKKGKIKFNIFGILV